MTWYVYVADYDTGDRIITESFSDQNDAFNAANTWYTRGNYDIKVYEGE